MIYRKVNSRNNNDLGDINELFEVKKITIGEGSISSVVVDTFSSVFRAVQVGKVVHLTISGTLKDTQTRWGDIATGLPGISSKYGSNIYIPMVSAAGYIFPLVLGMDGKIYKGSNSPIGAAFYEATITYIID